MEVITQPWIVAMRSADANGVFAAPGARRGGGDSVATAAAPGTRASASRPLVDGAEMLFTHPGQIGRGHGRVSELAAFVRRNGGAPSTEGRDDPDDECECAGASCQPAKREPAKREPAKSETAKSETAQREPAEREPA